MKKNTYRCEDEKYKKLQLKLVQDEMSWQGFVDKAVDDYLEGNYNPKGEKEMKIIEIVELNQRGVNVKEQNNDFATRYFDDNGGLPDGNFDEESIAGTWIHLEGEHTDFVKYAYRSIDNSTLVPEQVFRDYLINELAGNYIEVDFDWLKENDEELLDWITTSEYWGRGFDRKIEKTEVVARISFHEGGNRVYATFKSHPEQVKQSLNNQPPWGEDSWEDWETEDIAKYYNEFINQS